MSDKDVIRVCVSTSLQSLFNNKLYKTCGKHTCKRLLGLFGTCFPFAISFSLFVPVAVNASSFSVQVSLK